MSWLTISIFIGGLYPTYMHYREHENRFWSALNALAWPVDLGSWIAEKVYDAKEDGE